VSRFNTLADLKDRAEPEDLKLVALEMFEGKGERAQAEKDRFRQLVIAMKKAIARLRGKIYEYVEFSPFLSPGFCRAVIDDSKIKREIKELVVALSDASDPDYERFVEPEDKTAELSDQQLVLIDRNLFKRLKRLCEEHGILSWEALVERAVEEYKLNHLEVVKEESEIEEESSRELSSITDG